MSYNNKKIRLVYPKMEYNKNGLIKMLINTKNLVSISEANQNFSKVAHLVDENSAATILKNNIPKYILFDYNQLETEIFASDDKVTELAQKMLNRSIVAFNELAK